MPAFPQNAFRKYRVVNQEDVYTCNRGEFGNEQQRCRICKMVSSLEKVTLGVKKNSSRGDSPAGDSMRNKWKRWECSSEYRSCQITHWTDLPRSEAHNTDF